MALQPTEILSILKAEIAGLGNVAEIAEIGRVISVGDGIVKVWGLNKVQSGEMVIFKDDVLGMVLNLETETVGIVIFGDVSQIREGDIVMRTGKIMEVPVGKGLLGRVTDGLGNPIDGHGPLQDIQNVCG